MSNHQLTHKQEKFILAVVEGKTQADAYRHAYDTSKMTDKSIHEKASALMANVKVRSRYNELMDKVKSKLEEKAIVTVEGLLNDLQTIKETCMIKKKAYIKNEIGEPEEVELDDFIDASAALKAVELMGKHLKMFTDKVESNNTNYNYNYEAELMELIK